jgi:hypothetical protein
VHWPAVTKRKSMRAQRRADYYPNVPLMRHSLDISQRQKESLSQSRVGRSMRAPSPMLRSYQRASAKKVSRRPTTATTNKSHLETTCRVLAVLREAHWRPEDIRLHLTSQGVAGARTMPLPSCGRGDLLRLPVRRPSHTHGFGRRDVLAFSELDSHRGGDCQSGSAVKAAAFCTLVRSAHVKAGDWHGKL